MPGQGVSRPLHVKCERCGETYYRLDWPGHLCNLKGGELVTDNQPLETSRTEILKEAARAVCWMCAKGKYELIINDGKYWHKTGYLFTRCHAQGIYRLIEAGQG